MPILAVVRGFLAAQLCSAKPTGPYTGPNARTLELLPVVLKRKPEDANRKPVPSFSLSRSRTADGNTTAAWSFLHVSLTLQRLTLLS